MSITCLNDDILREVFLMLDDHDLFPLERVCKHWKQIVEYVYKWRLQQFARDIEQLLVRPNSWKEAHLMLHHSFDPKKCAPELLLENSQRKVTRINSARGWRTVLSKYPMWKCVHLWKIELNCCEEGNMCLGITDPDIELTAWIGTLKHKYLCYYGFNATTWDSSGYLWTSFKQIRAGQHMYMKLDLDQGGVYLMTPGMNDFSLLGKTWSNSSPYYMFVTLHHLSSSVTVTKLPVNAALEPCGEVGQNT